MADLKSTKPLEWLNFFQQGFLPGADFVKYRQSKKLRILDTQ